MIQCLNGMEKFVYVFVFISERLQDGGEAVMGNADY